jgi:hypothetical protein
MGEAAERVASVDIKATMLLADFAQVAEGKLNVMGGGWTITSVGSSYFIALKLEIPTTEARDRAVEFRLLDRDGQPVAPNGDAISITGTLGHTGLAPAFPELPADIPIALPVPPLPLEAGKRYEWRLYIDGETSEDWSLEFSTRSGNP